MTINKEIDTYNENEIISIHRKNVYTGAHKE